MALESLISRQYSFKSDVWSFGVTAWEVLTRSQPWASLSAMEAAFIVRDGGRLSIPDDTSICPVALKELIQSCWRVNPNERPDFDSIWNQLREMMNNLEKD